MKEKLLLECKKMEKIAIFFNVLLTIVLPSIFVILIAINGFVIYYGGDPRAIAKANVISNFCLLLFYILFLILNLVFRLMTNRLFSFYNSILIGESYSIFMSYEKLKKTRMINPAYRKLEKEIEEYIYGI